MSFEREDPTTCLRFISFHIEADPAGGKIFIARRVEVDTDRPQVPLSLGVQLCTPRGDSRRADVLVKTNGLR